jgi:DNA-binding MarR family transcriptional regulator
MSGRKPRQEAGKEYFSMVPSSMLKVDLTKSEWRVWLALDYRQGNNSKAWPAIKTISKDTNLPESTVRASIASLEAYGLVTVSRVQGKGNYYHVMNSARRRNETIPLMPSKPAKRSNLKPRVRLETSGEVRLETSGEVRLESSASALVFKRLTRQGTRSKELNQNELENGQNSDSQNCLDPSLAESLNLENPLNKQKQKGALEEWAMAHSRTKYPVSPELLKIGSWIPCFDRLKEIKPTNTLTHLTSSLFSIWTESEIEMAIKSTDEWKNFRNLGAGLDFVLKKWLNASSTHANLCQHGHFEASCRECFEVEPMPSISFKSLFRSVD